MLQFDIHGEILHYDPSLYWNRTLLYEEFSLKLGIQFTGDYEEDFMVFNVTIEGGDSFFCFTDEQPLKVHKETGLTDNGEFTGLFMDTQNFKGYHEGIILPDISVTRYFEGFEVNRDLEYIRSYDGSIHHEFNIDTYELWTVDGNDEYLFREDMQVSQNAGIVIATEGKIEITASDGIEYSIDYQMVLDAYSGVKVENPTDPFYLDLLVPIVVASMVSGVLFYYSMKLHLIDRILRRDYPKEPNPKTVVEYINHEDK